LLVEVAVAAAVRGTFTYRLPPGLSDGVEVGHRVAVPFGRSARATGYVVGFPERPPPGVALKDVAGVLDPFPLFTPPLLELLRWAQSHYLAPPGELLRVALPPGLNTRKGADAPRRRGVELAEVSEAGRQPGALASLSRAKAQRATLEYLLARGRVPTEELRAAFPKGRSALRALAAREWVSLTTEAVQPSGALLAPDVRSLPNLTEAQRTAVEAIGQADAGFAPFLLHGVTGSGKTEVYLRVIAQTLAAGRGALVLVPEIALTPQLAGRFRQRFGDAVALLHSGLSEPERHAEWLRVRNGSAPICVGVRSAIFAPVQRLGVVVVDEEHDGSFKQEESPSYHARDLAVVRARIEGAACVLGSATPSLESLENVRRGRYRKLTLPSRIDDRPMPAVELVDLRRRGVPPLPAGKAVGSPPLLGGSLRPALRADLPRREGVSTPSPLSAQLTTALWETVAAGKQAILFLNRRGFATLVLCHACGKEERCPDCSVALTFHARRRMLLCHYCGRSQRMLPTCPECGAERATLGVGTEQVEAAVREAVPGARVARLDRDTVSGADDTAALLARFARREVDVLVGTQMVTKGHDFPGVTLVGVVLADIALAIPDFRAAERAFQILTQVAGRAGRGADAGRVLIQTYNPDNDAIRCAVAQDYQGFSEAELARRERHGFPPFARLMALKVEGSQEGARRCAEALGNAARPVLRGGMSMLGPAPAAIERIRGKDRWHLLFRAPDHAALKRIHQALAPVLARPPGGASIRVDMDPQSMM
jgi:primosomal protein N' (replication factor Y)